MVAVLLVAACASQSAASLHASPARVSAPPRAPSTAYAVVVKDFLAGGPTYTVSIVGSDGQLFARATARKRTMRSQIGSLSTSLRGVYFLDGDSEVHSLTPDGATNLVTTIPVLGSEVAAFAVSPDDTRIAVSILDFTRYPVGTRLYIEDLHGGGHHIELFSSKTVMEWPVGWHKGRLVIAVGLNTQPQNAGEGFSRATAEYHVADAATGKRYLTLCPGGGGPVPESPAGALCIGTGPYFVTWDGAERPMPTVKLTSGPQCLVLGVVSPAGEIATTTISPDAVHCGNSPALYLVGADGTLDPTPVAPHAEAVGWIDANFVVVDSAFGSPTPELSIVDVATRTASRVQAAGFLAAVLPGGL